eukprot:3142288-Amphidinium_carterae.1
MEAYESWNAKLVQLQAGSAQISQNRGRKTCSISCRKLRSMGKAMDIATTDTGMDMKSTVIGFCVRYQLAACS